MRSASPALFLCVLACASVPSTSRLSSTGVQPVAASTLAASTATSATSGRGTMITGSFITEYFNGETLHDVLRRRAPLYLRARPNPSADLTGRADPIAVYINRSFSGSLEVLQSIPASEVFSVERISAVDAVSRYGSKHNSGALLVTLVRRD
jgi:hypothetical protein